MHGIRFVAFLATEYCFLTTQPFDPADSLRELHHMHGIVMEVNKPFMIETSVQVTVKVYLGMDIVYNNMTDRANIVRYVNLVFFLYFF
jgi:hypothetical protein